MMNPFDAVEQIEGLKFDTGHVQKSVGRMLGQLGQVINPIRLGEFVEISLVLCGYLFFDKAVGGGSSFFVCRRSVVSSLGRRRFVFE